MQPLVLAFLRPLKYYYAQEVEHWLHAHPGLVVIIRQVGDLFGNAYKKAATVENTARVSEVLVIVTFSGHTSF
jgi:hypothetical protein